jgi:hypothetical protein
VQDIETPSPRGRAIQQRLLMPFSAHRSCSVLNRLRGRSGMTSPRTVIPLYFIGGA